MLSSSNVARRTFCFGIRTTVIGSARCSSSSSASSSLSPPTLSHVDPNTNRPCMVDITHKVPTARVAQAQALVELPTAAFNLIKPQDTGVEIYSAKGPVFSTAIIAGVMGAKNTSSILPFCHPLPLEYVNIKIDVDKALIQTIRIDCIVKTTHKTGVEMEALIGATHAAVCIYDMLKAVSHDIVIKDIKLISKSGGKSAYVNNELGKP